MKLNYRPEIDGLRALAVLPVILFHAGFSWFRGGFVGVDVFFVISGFLITSILLTDLESDRFNLINFYERRARRILPALLVVVAACTPAAWLLLPYSDLVEFGRSIVSVAAFVSNVHFWQTTGYFETASELKPLLHTWSLAVEEQYYIVAPILLWVLWTRAKRALVPVLGALALVSLALAEHGIRVAPDAAFFLPHTRVWELALGALGAVMVKNSGGVQSSNGLSLTGLALIVASIFLLDEATPFPGLYALLPTVGAVLVLVFAGPDTITSRILGTRALVGIGLVSYSAYLWHQPLFAFARQLSVSEPAPNVMLALSLLTLVLAYLSWRFVEQPFRQPRTVPRRAIFSLSAIGLAACVAVGIFVAKSDASQARVTFGGVNFLALSNSLRSNPGINNACRQFGIMPQCASGPEPIALLWGDSHAMHLAQALRDSPTPLPFIQMTQSGCPPVLGIAANDGKRYNVEWGMECIRQNAQVLEWLKAQPTIRYVILASTFAVLAGQGRVTLDDGSVVTGNHGEPRLIETIERIRDMGKSAVLIAPSPMPNFNVGRCLTIQSIWGQGPDRCHFELQENRRTPIVEKLIEVSNRTSTGIVRMSDLICEGDLCLSSRDGAIIYRDAGHLSVEGSALLGRSKDLARRVLKAAHGPAM